MTHSFQGYPVMKGLICMFNYNGTLSWLLSTWTFSLKNQITSMSVFSGCHNPWDDQTKPWQTDTTFNRYKCSVTQSSVYWQHMATMPSDNHCEYMIRPFILFWSLSCPLLFCHAFGVCSMYQTQNISLKHLTTQRCRQPSGQWGRG